MDILLPDLGDFKDVEVIEIHVAKGDKVNKDDPILTLESDKASLDVPAPEAGVINELKIKLGDKINQGDLIATFDCDQTAPATTPEPQPAAFLQPAQAESTPAPAPATPQAASETTIKTPNLGDFEAVEIIDVAVSQGDTVAVDDILLTVESDKASMDIPSPYAGTIGKLLVKVGDKISKGSELAVITTTGSTATGAPTPQPAARPQATQAAPTIAPTTSASLQPNGQIPMPGHSLREGKPHASPVVRKLAREFGVNLTAIQATGPKSRILKEDIQLYIKNSLAAKAAGGGLGFDLPKLEQIDFSQYGPVHEEQIPRIKQISGPFLHRNWLTIPHVTQFAEADITSLEEFRKLHSAEAKEQGFSLSPLAFIVKACTIALKKFPHFNSSLSSDGKKIIVKQYYHVGIAVDTVAGLVVPVLRDVDSKSVMEIAKEMSLISARAREGKLSPNEMRGGTFTITSLGGIDGCSFFTPIINHPEVAILGISRSKMQPVYDGKSGFAPRLMVPLALSYNHRVIDGSAGARFTAYLSLLLEDIRNVIL